MFSRTQKAWLTVLVACFVISLRSKVLSIILLKIQSPEGGLTFPMRGFSSIGLKNSGVGLGSLTSPEGYVVPYSSFAM